MSRQSGTWGTSRWGEDAWGVKASSVPVACDIDRPARHAAYASPLDRSYPGLDLAKVFLDGVDISGSVFSFSVRLAANSSANMARVKLYRGSLIIVSGGSEIIIKYDGVTIFSGFVADIPTEEGRFDSDITAYSPDEILASTPCQDISSQFYCSYLIQQAAGIGGFGVEFGEFQDYFLGLYRTETQELKTAYLGPTNAQIMPLMQTGSAKIPLSQHAFREGVQTVETTIWEAHRFASIRQAVDTLSSSLIKSNVFCVPGGKTLRISNWNRPRSIVGSVEKGAMFSCFTRDTTRGRINHLVLSCRDGNSIEYSDAADIAAHGLRRAEMSTQVGTAGSQWALGMAQSVVSESKAPVVEWETVLNPIPMPTDGLEVWTPDGEKTVKIESVEHSFSMDKSGASSRWSGKVMP